MISLAGRSLETGIVHGKCQDFLCPPESKIREMFPNALTGKLRARALDPYGTMVSQNNNKKHEIDITWKCQNENCHAKLCLRTVKPDNEGNTYGLFGCFAHQHEMPRKQKAEIVFQSKIDCQEFYDKHFRMLYGKGQKQSGQTTRFPCRRKCLGYNKITKTHNSNMGYIDCKSVFTMMQCFPAKDELLSISIEERPHCLSGVFFHNHKNDEKYHRKESGFGGWKRHNNSPLKPKAKRKNYYVPKKNRLEFADFNATSVNKRGRPKKK